jgi:hypothetical protein
MNEKIEATKDEVQGIEMVDLGDAVAETKQGSILPTALDSCCSYTYFGE